MDARPTVLIFIVAHEAATTLEKVIAAAPPGERAPAMASAD